MSSTSSTSPSPTASDNISGSGGAGGGRLTFTIYIFIAGATLLSFTILVSVWRGVVIRRRRRRLGLPDRITPSWARPPVEDLAPLPTLFDVSISKDFSPFTRMGFSLDWAILKPVSVIRLSEQRTHINGVDLSDPDVGVGLIVALQELIPERFRQKSDLSTADKEVEQEQSSLVTSFFIAMPSEAPPLHPSEFIPEVVIGVTETPALPPTSMP